MHATEAGGYESRMNGAERERCDRDGATRGRKGANGNASTGVRDRAKGSERDTVGGESAPGAVTKREGTDGGE